MGKLFRETIRSGKMLSFGRSGSAASIWERRERRALRQAWVRGVWRVWSAPLRRRVSFGG